MDNLSMNSVVLHNNQPGFQANQVCVKPDKVCSSLDNRMIMTGRDGSINTLEGLIASTWFS